ncbi:hypothetical protein [Xenorhabdus thuongxuanensis]|uniref:Uncharacterized protein n=1 Tax=Xenorhabdus thuongxuanensis TaxID=1873484 RepID=A0A1Q5U400_9GAMM|nr:hypothetical protein [Xenorhabdus thuongxuanensis]OKP07208.1 hypothetical protein Xentx_01480 [Xenorhabdus thuongxuanensis]
MKIKGSHYLFFILSVWFSQALALDLSYKSDIPADNKPSEEYLEKRDSLGHGSWNTEKLAKDNALAEKRENEQKEYNDKFNKHHNGLDKESWKLSYDWNEQQLKFFHKPQDDIMHHFKEQDKRRCYRETRQKLEKEQGNGYSYSDIEDACHTYY